MIDPQKFRPPQVMLVLYMAASILQFLVHPARIVDAGWIGWLVALSGFGFLLWSKSFFDRNGTPVRHSETPTKFVLEGPYRFTRNPMYVGGLIMFSGIAILAGTWPFFIVPVVMAMILQFVYIPWEEKTMTGLFGEDYKGYLNKTRRWI